MATWVLTTLTVLPRGCPAASYNITVGTDIIKAADDLANAWATNDSERIATLTNKISNYHDAVKPKSLTLQKQN